MEYVILGLLIIQPSTLYSLNKSFEQGISLFFSPSLGSINSAIKRLMDKNLVQQEDTVENGRAKKIITITEKGHNTFFSWMHDPLDPKNLEVSFMARLYFLGLIENQAQKKALVEGMYQSVIASKETLDETAVVLENLDIPQSYHDIFHYQKKVLQYGIDTHGYAIEWIEKLIMELDKGN
jgi:DNA-binding PadR family transcriptional regulator